MKRQRAKMKRRDPRIALEKVRKKGLCCLPPVKLVVLFFFILIVIFFCDPNV